QVVEEVGDLVLVLQQPVDGRLAAHRLADDLGGRLAVDVEERLVVQFVLVDHRGVEPDRVDDPQVVDLVAGDVAGADGVEDAVGDRRLDRNGLRRWQSRAWYFRMNWKSLQAQLRRLTIGRAARSHAMWGGRPGEIGQERLLL